MKYWSNIIKELTMLTQFGLSLITPLLMCLAISYLLMTRCSLGGWVFIPGFFFGLGGSFTFARKEYQRIIKRTGKEKPDPRKKGTSFNKHI